jgi:hypothetical protein
MKRLIFIFFFFSAIICFGQTDSVDFVLSSDTVMPFPEINIDDIELPPLQILENDYNSEDYIRYMCFFTGVDFGLVSLQNETFPIKPKQSFAVRLNLMEYKKQLVQNRFGFFSGISLGYQQIGFQNNFSFLPAGNQTILRLDSVDYLKNQLRSFSISIPFMFEINSKNTFQHTVHLAFGVQESYRYANSTYQMHKTSEATLIRKNSEDIHVNRFNLEACVRVGYQNLTFFASRSLTPLFSTNNFQTEIYPIVVGLCIVPANTKPNETDNFDF